MIHNCTFSLYLPNRADFHSRVKYDFPVAAISLSDYNTIREMLGYEPISLADGEFTTQWKAIATEGEQESFLQIQTDAGTLILSTQPYYKNRLGRRPIIPTRMSSIYSQTMCVSNCYL